MLNKKTVNHMFDWKKYYPYQVFDELIDTFILQKKSFITNHPQTLEISKGLEEINQCFIENYDASGNKNFDQKVRHQFVNASVDAKIIFANIEYLWAMPTSSINGQTKESYVTRWFSDTCKHGEKYFFDKFNAIGHAGVYYNLNKYFEIKALILLLKYILNIEDLHNKDQIKRVIADFSFFGLYAKQVELDPQYYVANRTCAIFNVLLHLCEPDNYEAIV